MPTRSEPRPYAGLEPAERQAARRHKLLGAALELFGSAGYGGTTIDRLCSRAGVSTKSFYLLYANKEAAFLDLYEAITARSFTMATSSLAETEGKPMVERIPAAFLGYLRPMLDDVRVARIAFVEVMGVSPAVEARRLQFRESLADVIVAEGSAAVDRGEIRPRNFRFATLSLAGAANAAVYDWAVDSRRQDVAQLEADLVQLALTVLAG